MSGLHDIAGTLDVNAPPKEGWGGSGGWGITAGPKGPALGAPDAVAALAAGVSEALQTSSFSAAARTPKHHPTDMGAGQVASTLLHLAGAAAQCACRQQKPSMNGDLVATLTRRIRAPSPSRSAPHGRPRCLRGATAGRPRLGLHRRAGASNTDCRSVLHRHI